MNFALGQLLYTSFPEIGFKLLTSEIPRKVQQFFLQQIVYQYWNPYNPPPSRYRGAYIYQISSEETLFGWIYNHGMDDLGRSHIPYFLCYYYQKQIKPVELDKIFIFLEKGPVRLIENKNTKKKLDNIHLSDLSNYESYYLGVEVPLLVRQETHVALHQKKLINIFVSSEQEKLSKIAQSGFLLDSYTDKQEVANIAQPDFLLDSYTDKQEVANIVHIHQNTMNSNQIEDILRELTSKPIGIQGAVLVSSEGELITLPIGFDENSALILAGIMLYLAKSTREELDWQGIDKISIQAKEGYLTLGNCGENIFLLVKAGQAVKGLIEGQINRTIQQLKIELEGSEMDTIINEARLETETFPQQNTPVNSETETKIRYLDRSQINSPASNLTENEIRYRGRRPSR